VFPKRRIYLHNWETNVFVDDTYRVRPNLTISLGLGYQFTSSFYEKQNYIARFDLGTGQLVWPKSVANLIQPYTPYFSFPYRLDGPTAMFTMTTLNFQPRIAIAWSPWGNKTVIQTGYGLYDVPYSTANITPIADPFPFSLGGSQQTSDDLLPQNAFQLGLPAPNLSPNLADAFGTPSLQFGDPKVHTPYVEMWNLNVQHEFGHGVVLTSGYVGNTAKHLNMITRPNAAAPGPGALAPRRPFPAFSRFIDVTWQGISNYNGWQTNLNKHFNDGSQLIASYAFGKALGNTDELVSIATSGGTEIPPLDYLAIDGRYSESALRYDYGRASFDFRHIFRTGFVYSIPVGRGKKLLGGTNRAVDGVIGGWQLSGEVVLQSGQAFTVGGGANLNAERSSRPDQVCNGNLPLSQRTVLRDFNTACYQTQPAFTDGSVGRNTLTQRPLENLNLAIAKSFHMPLGEASRLQFRAEAFNATNTPSFGIPDSSCCGSTTFGQISSTERDYRVVQMGMKLLF